MLFYGADLDITCCKMTLVNMLLNSLRGEVAHMNTLSDEFYRGYKVETTPLNGYYYLYYIEFTDPEQSCIWLRPLDYTATFKEQYTRIEVSSPTNGIQRSLF